LAAKLAMTFRFTSVAPFSFHELEAVSERIRNIYAVVAGHALVVRHFDTGRTKPLREHAEAAGEKGRVRLAGRAEVRVDADVDAYRVALEPAPTARREGIGFRNFGDLQEPGVEPTREILPAARHGELDVVDAQDPHHSVRVE